MNFQVDPKSATPLYEQLASQVRLAVAGGRLLPGDALPSVRQVAHAVRINPNTVARAYRDLEAAGIVDSRQGSGTFVAASAPRLSAGERRRALQAGLDKLAAEAHALGVPPAELGRLATEAARRLEQERETAQATRRGDRT